MTKYWVSRDGERLGPYDEAQIYDAYGKGTLRPTDELWTEGMELWVPVSEVFEYLHAAVAHPDDSVPDIGPADNKNTK